MAAREEEAGAVLCRDPETLTGFWARVRGCSESSSWKPLPQRWNHKEREGERGREGGREREIEAFTPAAGLQ